MMTIVATVAVLLASVSVMNSTIAPSSATTVDHAHLVRRGTIGHWLGHSPPSGIRLSIGRVIKGWRVVSEIGKDSKSRTYKLQSVATPTQFATAKVAPSAWFTASSVDREYAILKVLQNDRELLPFMLQPMPIGVLSVSGRRILPMEDWAISLVDYLTNMQKKMANNGPGRATKVRELFYSIVFAVNRIHHHGYVHGDIRPDNFVIVKRTNPDDNQAEVSVPAIVNFSLSYKLKRSGSNSPGYFAKQPKEYIPPEALIGAKLKSRDPKQGEVFSLGQVLFVMLFGAPALRDWTREGSVKLTTATVPGGKIDPLFLDLLQRMLLFDPQKRITLPAVLKHPALKSQPNGVTKEALVAAYVATNGIPPQPKVTGRWPLIWLKFDPTGNIVETELPKNDVARA